MVSLQKIMYIMSIYPTIYSYHNTMYTIFPSHSYIKTLFSIKPDSGIVSNKPHKVGNKYYIISVPVYDFSSAFFRP